MQAHRSIVYPLFRYLSRERLERSVFDSTDDTFYQFLCRETVGVPIPNRELRDAAEYNTYSFLGFLLKFLWNDMEGDVDQRIERIGFIYENNSHWLISRYSTEKRIG